MATTTYISAVNEVFKELGEPTLSGFSEAVGFHAFVLDAFNKALNDVNQEEKEWPFNKVFEASLELVPGRQFYSFPTNMATVDWESFFIRSNEEITNHEISGDDTGWTISGSGVFSSASAFNGIVLQSGAAISQDVDVITNTQYRLNVRTLNGPVGITLGTSSGASDLLSATSTVQNYGKGEFYFTSFSTSARNLNIRVEALSGSATVDLISVRADFVSDHLQNIDYDEWRQRYREVDFDMPPDSYTKPRVVFPTNNSGQVGVSPIPDYPYRVEFDYWQVPTDLVSATEVATLPERFMDVVLRRTLYYCYKYRRDWDAVDREDRDFQKYIKKMRIEYLNKPKDFWPR